MPPTLTAVDNRDGTGLTATVAGGLPGDVWDFSAAVPPGSFDLLGSRTGDGSVVLPAGLGSNILSAQNQAFVLTNTVVVLVTTGALATATRCRRAVRAVIESLGLPIAEVAEQWTPDETNLEYPAVILTPENVMETEENPMSQSDDIGYPTRVMIADKQEKYDHDALPDYESWRETIADAFRNRQLAAVDQNVICRVEWDAIINPNLPRFMYAVSELVIRVFVRKNRP